jgi:hypothetical protein
MRRDRNRDYATDAFQFSAQVGGYQKYRDALHEQLTREVAEYYQRPEAPSDGGDISDPEAAAHDRYKKLIAEYEPDLLDLEAADETMTLMQVMGWQRDKCAAVRHVYQKDPLIDLDGDVIREFVHGAEINIPASERAVYGWLYDARAIFSWKRNMRLTPGQTRRLRQMNLI